MNENTKRSDSWEMGQILAVRMEKMDLLGNDLLQYASHKGEAKAVEPLYKTAILGFLAGVYISLGYLLYFKVMSSITTDLNALIGALFFPIGLLLIVVAGGELFTGNILELSLGFYLKVISCKDMVKNWLVVLIFNAIGAMLTASCAGSVMHFVTNQNRDVLEHMVLSKIDASPLEMIVSGIFCNILVTLAIWLADSSQSHISKMVLIWPPVAAFVFLGFQHSVANVFLLTMGMANGLNSLSQMMVNLFFVVIGNLVGGALVVGGMYAMAYKEDSVHVTTTDDVAEVIN